VLRGGSIRPGWLPGCPEHGPEPPCCLLSRAVPQLYSKIRREIVRKEQEAYAGRQAAGVFKPIERGKLEAKIREFVRDSIRRYHERRGGY
jgi:hypothetical protein